MLDKVTTKWEAQDVCMEERMDTLIKLEQQKMELEKQRLALKREIAGLHKQKGQFLCVFFLVSGLTRNEIAK